MRIVTALHTHCDRINEHHRKALDSLKNKLYAWLSITVETRFFGCATRECSVGESTYDFPKREEL